ncbi:HEAT repeat-containing protein 6 [Lamellibrachia satsuma]|nr:HEAT repeat-containing protein 6 [Lamellibrachia satsuma]
MDQLSMCGDPVRGAYSDPFALSVWGNMSSSESEFSDTEGATGKAKAVHSKVRHCVLACFHAVIKATDKRTMFGYWSSFIPNTPGIGPLPQAHTLFTVIIKDPSPKARTGSLALLTALLEGSKQYLMVAEESEQYRTAPFTPFSVTLGHMIKEIHRCLLLALVAENSPRAITQIIKCLATLVPNVPYQRLKPGLLSKLVKQLKPFLSHRDPNIRVGCLTCLGAMVSTQSPLLEVCHILQPHSLPGRLSLSSSPASNTNHPPSHTDPMLPGDNINGASPLPSPSGSSGNLTPMSTPAEGGDTCWLMRLCIGNVTLHLMDETEGVTRGSDSLQPLPVRLESLQLLAQLAKGYFPLVRTSLLLIRRLIEYCLRDQDTAIQLHGMKLLEVTTASLLLQVQNTTDCTQMHDFWLYVITAMLPLATQPNNYYAVRSAACDCLANIGPVLFEKLPMDKQVLCITWLLGMTHDDNHHVRAAAVRGLGICILYPCLREDVSFVADTANTVIVAMEETSIVVRAKAAWSLGNLSDALVLNKDGGDTEFVDDFSDMLLLKLFNLAIAGCHDNDKVKYNTVRALGSLLHYLPARSVDNSRFKETVQLCIETLIKNIGTGSMKVRWNACYAVGRMLHNENLAVGEAPWTHDLYTALTSVVKQCNNFKVKINAATALSVPRVRRCYGNAQEMASVWSSLVEALQTAELITDFGEFRYRENLVDQVCGTLVHLAKLLQQGDLDLVGASFSDDPTLLQGYMLKYRQLLNSQTSEVAEEKGSAMSAAVAHVESLATLDNLSDSELICIRSLTQLLTKTLPSDEKISLQATPASPTSFLQTYD